MGSFEFVTRHLVVDHEEYWFEIDEYRRGAEQFLLAHIFFEKFSPSILKRVFNEWKAFRTCVKAPLYAVCDDGDAAKWERFVSRLGFRPMGIEVDCNNGERRPLFISEATCEQQL